MYLSEIQVGLAVFIVTFVAVWLFIKYGTPNKARRPPGPWSLPVVGNFLQTGSKPHLTLPVMSRKYGDVFEIYMGSQRTVVISGLETIKKALLQDSTTFAGRPQLWSFQFFGDRQFGFTTYDERYKLHRRIARHALYMFTNNRDNPVEYTVQREVKQLVEDLLSHGEEAVNSKSDIVPTAAASIIYSISFGGNRTQLRGDETFNEFLKSMGRGNTNNSKSFLADFIPVSRPFLRNSIKLFADRISDFVSLVQDKIEEHKKSYKDGFLRDSTDALISATQEHSQEEKDRVGLTDHHILHTVRSFIGAGTGTLTSFVKWAVLYMIKFPDVQKKVQSEIDATIGMDTPLSFAHRSQLPYTEATMWEIIRHVVPLPFLIPHATVNDTVLNGFHIKKDTLVMFNMRSISRDETLWTKPEEFNPEHFLDDTGSVVKDKAECIMAFGAGKRRCIGEKLGKIELFLFFATLMQKCIFTSVPGQVLNLEPTFSFANEAASYDVIVTPRNNTQE